MNQHHPQTLYIATILLYLNAAISALFGAIGSPLGLALVVVMVAAAFGIANDKRWGYRLGVVVSGLALIPPAIAVAANTKLLFNVFFLTAIVFPVALFALLVYPQSREYERIWFE